MVQSPKSRFPFFGTASEVQSKAENVAGQVPKMLMAAHTAAASILSGEHTRNRAGQGERFWQFREYTTHDRPQDIDWRQSAKTDRIYVREKEKQSSQTLLVWVNDGDGMNWRGSEDVPTKRAVAEVIALAVAILASHSGEMFRLFKQGARPARTDRAIETLAETLVNDRENHASLQSLFSTAVPDRCIPVLVGDFLLPVEDLDMLLSGFAEKCRGGALVQVLDPAEINLPYQGRVEFASADGANREVVENVSAIRQTYQDRLAAHNEKLQKLAQKYNWNFYQMTTDQDPALLVRELWMALALETQITQQGGGE